MCIEWLNFFTTKRIKQLYLVAADINDSRLVKYVSKNFDESSRNYQK